MKRPALVSLAMIGVAVAGIDVANGHDGYDHYKNPVTGISCCDRRDCRPMSADEVEARLREVPAGVMVDGNLFPKDQLQEGPDGRWHICEHPITKTLFCVLTPRPSF